MALKHAQELAGQVKLAAAACPKGRGVEMQEQASTALAQPHARSTFDRPPHPLHVRHPVSRPPTPDSPN